jgi:hypothetical protein
MDNDFITSKDLLAIGLSTLISTIISAFGAPVGPVIAALLIGGLIRAYLMNRYHRAGA